MEGLQFISNEKNINYFQNLTKAGPSVSNFNNKQIRPNGNFVSGQQNFMQNRLFNSQTPHNAFRNRFPSQPITNIRPNFNRTPQHFFTNSQVFGKPNNKNIVSKSKPK